LEELVLELNNMKNTLSSSPFSTHISYTTNNKNIIKKNNNNLNFLTRELYFFISLLLASYYYNYYYRGVWREGGQQRSSALA